MSLPLDTLWFWDWLTDCKSRQNEDNASWGDSWIADFVTCMRVQASGNKGDDECSKESVMMNSQWMLPRKGPHTLTQKFWPLLAQSQSYRNSEMPDNLMLPLQLWHPRMSHQRPAKWWLDHRKRQCCIWFCMNMAKVDSQPIEEISILALGRLEERPPGCRCAECLSADWERYCQFSLWHEDQSGQSHGMR